jgi:LacI family transcriptional regulator
MARKPRNASSGVVRLADVAGRAGVSLATASRVVSGTTERVVAEDLRERVLRAAAELGYVPNATAQAMARGRSNLVGLIVHDISDPYFSTVAAGVMREARAAGLLVTLADTQRRPGEELSYAAAFRRDRARAIIVAGSRTTARESTDRLAGELAAFEAEGGRAVAISQPRLPVDTIAIENRSGAAALAHALHDLGYRRFVVLAGPPEMLTAADRLAGFREGLAQRGSRLLAEDIVHSDFTRDGGYEATGRVLDQGSEAECVFAVNDVMAVGAMACLRDRSVALPGDMAVAGFDDIITLRDITPSLTTVQVPLEDVGARAARLVLQPAGREVRVEEIACRVVIRASTPGKRAPERRQDAAA